MSQTITITAKSMAKELNKWQMANHNPFQNRRIEVVDSFDKQTFDKTLKKVSRKTSEPVAKTK